MFQGRSIGKASHAKSMLILLGLPDMRKAERRKGRVENGLSVGEVRKTADPVYRGAFRRREAHTFVRTIVDIC
jgi:hypothetical protein